ncbi:hypothetical protein CL620_03400 [archaeon]|nr:hypothetical protein [archaeon]|tara:strand:+ start:52 stop:324 length:273 start_codon:yes stop_codon:yes gene_type:complete
MKLSTNIYPKPLNKVKAPSFIMKNVLNKNDMNRLKSELEKTQIPSDVIHALVDEGKTLTEAWEQHCKRVRKVIDNNAVDGVKANDLMGWN